MLRRILIGAAIASTVFAGSATAYADDYPKKDDKKIHNEHRCSPVANIHDNDKEGLLVLVKEVIGLDLNVVNQNSPIAIGVLGAHIDQDVEYCENDD
ncbi:hypothetical protein ACFXJ8_20340 [Nonomuraea sp. NPDC059194]|uniref:hypothetical protein n=1 Tax=Nonomuraea sp. NPDC059194 TaxID=3346764 RepID=UPI0036C683D0